MTEKDLLEMPFENEILAYLLAHGYQESCKEDYDFSSAMDVAKLRKFVMDTQPKEWAKFEHTYKGEALANLQKLFSDKIQEQGLLTVLKKALPIEDYLSGAKFIPVYFNPANPLMTKTRELAQHNVFSVRKEFAYENKVDSKRVDLAIFLNGLPLFMIEVKKQTANQCAQIDGEEQYKNARDPAALPFQYGRRTLAFFTLDEFAVFMTTRLAGQQTYFLPFNKGSEDGRENPGMEGKHSTCYFWEELLNTNNVLRLIKDFLFIDREGKLIFPRYHQLRAVLRAENDLITKGIGGRYLIWHSAGSGKTKTIGWLSAVLINNAEVNTVIVISDRIAINSQLSTELQTLYNPQQVISVESGNELKNYLDRGGYIIVTTLQKFREVLNIIKGHIDRNYAFVIDEAHSSTAGKSFAKMAETLTGKTLDEAAQIDSELEVADDAQYKLMQEKAYIQKSTNASYFAFTATPKTETMELFGTRTEDGKKCFDLYSMKQAITEGFILNPLNCYTGYDELYHVSGINDKGEEYDKKRAEGAVKHFVSSQPSVIREKTNIILDDFFSKRIDWLKGKAKAMILTPSRLHAVYYKKMVDAYLAAHYAKVKALVAFTGEIELDGVKYTEANMNREFSTVDLVSTIHNNADLRIIIVADKLQTGFDEPLLAVMYVDKYMGSAVKAVQTYSRINRIYPHKKTLIMDFANKPSDIQGYFEEFYGGKLFLPKKNEMQPGVLFKLRDEILAAGIFDREDVEELSQLIQSQEKNAGRISGKLDIIRARVLTKPEEEKTAFLVKLGKINKLYYFLGTLYNKWDKELGRFASICELLGKILKQILGRRDKKLFAAAQHIQLDIYHAKLKLTEENIVIKDTPLELPPVKTETRIAEKPKAGLSEIVQAFNAKYPQGEEEIVKQIRNLSRDADLVEKVQSSSLSAGRTSIIEKVNDFILEAKMDDNPQRRAYYAELDTDKSAMNRVVEAVWSLISGTNG